jgi:hypothetical protein
MPVQQGGRGHQTDAGPTEDREVPAFMLRRANVAAKGCGPRQRAEP